MRETHETDPDPVNNPRRSWEALRGWDRLAPLLALAIAALLAGSRLPPGVCYGDSGDLQLASATLGISHPPGYAGFVTIGYIVTRIPGVDPAYLVSLACLGSGLITLLLCILIQIRLGVSPWAASAVGLGWVVHPLVWTNLVAPEVYMPSLAFVAGAAYLLMRHARVGSRRDLLIAAVLFGIALANRPPVLFAAPFFLIAWWVARRPQDRTWRRSMGPLLLVVGCAVLPSFYSLGYLLWRDAPGTPYNYIEEHNTESNGLPDLQGSLPDRLERVLWLATGRQFGDQMGNTWRGIRAKLRWLRGRLGPDESFAFLMCLVLVATGAAIATRRCTTGALLLGGMAFQSVIFVCAYRIYGQAADLLPLLFAGAVFGGAAVSPLLPARGAGARRLIAVAAFGAVSAGVVVAGPHRDGRGPRRDATPFVASLDLPTFPDHAVILSGWDKAMPLRYAHLVLSDRRDIRIVTAHPGRWLEMAGNFSDRPVYVTTSHDGLKNHNLTPYRGLWRLGRASTAAVPE